MIDPQLCECHCRSDAIRVPLLAREETSGIIMKHLVRTIAVLCVTALSTAALAEDRSDAASPPTPPIAHPWSSCFAGLGVAYGQNHTDITSVNKPGANFGSETDQGVLGGVSLGCDHQIGSWVIGIGSELNFGGLDGSHPIPTFPTFIYKNSVPWLVTETLRGGYAITNDLLVYARGGAAWTENDITVDFTVPRTGLSESATDSRMGWTLGAGSEYRFLDHWFAFVEYNYSDFGKKNVSFTRGPATGSSGVTDILAITQNLQTVVVGAGFRF
jgi:outer membrane immunogenic protein